MKYHVTIIGVAKHDITVEANDEEDAKDIAVRWVDDNKRTRIGVLSHLTAPPSLEPVAVEFCGKTGRTAQRDR